MLQTKDFQLDNLSLYIKISNKAFVNYFLLEKLTNHDIADGKIQKHEIALEDLIGDFVGEKLDKIKKHSDGTTFTVLVGYSDGLRELYHQLCDYIYNEVMNLTTAQLLRRRAVAKTEENFRKKELQKYYADGRL